MVYERHHKNVYVLIKEENGKYIKDLDNTYTKAEFDTLCEEYKKNLINQSVATTNDASSDNNALNTLIDKLINDKDNHIKELLAEECLYDINNLKDLVETTIAQLLFSSGRRDLSLKLYKKKSSALSIGICTLKVQ